MGRHGRGLIGLTIHSKIRYIQRVLGVEGEKEAYSYLSENDLKVSFEIWTLFSNSKLVFENFTSTRGQNRVDDIYLVDDIILILSETDVLLTLWKIEHDANPENFLYLTESMVTKINSNKGQIKELNGRKEKLGLEARMREFSLTQITELIQELDKAGETATISILKARFERLSKECDLLIEEARTIYQNVKSLKKDNRIIMKKLMHGFIE